MEELRTELLWPSPMSICSATPSTALCNSTWSVRRAFTRMGPHAEQLPVIHWHGTSRKGLPMCYGFKKTQKYQGTWDVRVTEFEYITRLWDWAAQKNWWWRESNPITGLDRPWGFQEVEAPTFQDNRHMKVVRLSALRTGRLYPQGSIPGTHFC